MRKIHLILSLAAGLWLAVSGISGSLLVFGDALEQFLHPSLFTIRSPGRSIAVDTAIRAAESASGGRATRIRLAGSNTPVHEVWIDCDDCRRVWIDPSTGAVNGVRSAHGTTRTFLHELHRRMLMRGPGDVASLAGGVSLIAVALTGLWLGWRGGLRIRRLNFYELHRVVGLGASVPLILSAATGIYFIQAGLKAPLARPDGARASAVQPSLDAAAGSVRGAEATWISLADPVVVRMRRDGEKHPNGTTFVRIEDASVRVTEKPNRIYPLHIGTTGGYPHRLLLVIAGCTPAVLLVTGLVLWRRRSRRSRVLERSAAACCRPAGRSLLRPFSAALRGSKLPRA